ncbi:hypothetical protein LEUCIP111803_00940 [Leucobacter soli]|uniref:Integral membrane bound transporter domain-containing protein n=2 Tax=Leucobacter soli TaxID=2812850 RepID=A0A916NML3_9MICO|nr:hypothetical protein LEUCIP111803_00940 [Leucobacter soli]
MFAETLRSLVRLPAGVPPRRWIALRAALSSGIPLAVLTALGHERIGLQVAAGAFLAIYGANRSARDRAKLLPFVAAGMLACAALGAWSAPIPWLHLSGLVAIAIAAPALAFGYRLGPPGPVFFVILYGLAGYITHAVDGVRVNDPLVFLLAVAAGAAFSYLLAVAPLVRAAERAKPGHTLPELLPGPWLGHDELTLVMRSGLVAVLGVLVSVLWLDPLRAYWPVAAGIAVLGLASDRWHALERALHRSVGTVIGAGAFLLLVPAAEVPWLLVAVIFVLQFVIEIIVPRNYALALVFVTPLVLLIIQVASGVGDPGATAAERVLDTVIGAALASAVALVIRRERRA